MNTYKSSAQLKGMSKEQLFGHYGTVIGALFLVGIISLVADSIPSSLIRASSIPELIIYYLIGFLITLFLGIFNSGEAFLYLSPFPQGMSFMVLRFILIKRYFWSSLFLSSFIYA